MKGWKTTIPASADKNEVIAYTKYGNAFGTQAFMIQDWVEDRNSENWLIDNTENYSGEFLNDIFTGEGTYRWADGATYTGTWAAGKKHGRGYYQFGTGMRSERIFEFDVQVDF